MIDTLGDDGHFPLIELGRIDADGRPHVRRERKKTASSAHCDTGVVIPEQLLHLMTGQRDLLHVPLYGQPREPVATSARLSSRHRHPINGRQPLLDLVKPSVPGDQLLFVISSEPHLSCCQHAHDLLTAHFESAAEAVMRGTAEPGGLYQIFATDQQAGALRTSKTLSTAIGHQVCALFNMWIGKKQLFR